MAAKLKRCRHCSMKFEPKYSTLQVCCTTACAVAYARESAPKRLEADRRRARVVEKREEKEKLRRRRDWVVLARDAFNAFIRERDKSQPCISCGRVHVERTLGGSWDAGHYRTVGAAPQLRFDESNCHRQCKSCNGGGGRFSHKRETVDSRYRIELVRRVGLAEVERLECDNTIHRHTVEELQAVIALYRSKLRELRKGE